MSDKGTPNNNPGSDLTSATEALYAASEAFNEADRVCLERSTALIHAVHSSIYGYGRVFPLDDFDRATEDFKQSVRLRTRAYADFKAASDRAQEQGKGLD
jgi:hypothetical protein